MILVNPIWAAARLVGICFLPIRYYHPLYGSSERIIPSWLTHGNKSPKALADPVDVGQGKR